MTLQPGSVFAGYLVEHRVGVGGMGAVYAARHPRLPLRVALKVLSENLGADPDFRSRFQREAELAARVDHPNVVSVYDRGVEADQLWIAMQFVDGVDVHQLIKRSGSALTPARAVFIVGEAAKGLDSAHRRGLLHRDVKPANILVAENADEGDHVVVTDFGIARALDQTSALTNAGSIAATLPFASPEQIAGRDVDHRSDIYSLGCTLYVMLTGSFPFPRDSQIAVMHAHLTEPPPRVTVENPSLPSEMDQVIARAMAKDPGQRFGSCRELASAARAALSLSGTGNATESPPSPATVIPALAPPSADTAHTLIPNRGVNAHHTSRTMRAGLIGAATVLALIALVVGGIVVSRAHQSTPIPVVAESSAAPTPPSAIPDGPWQAYDFVAEALPGLMPTAPADVSYGHSACQPVNARFEPVNDLGTAVPIARIMCTPTEDARYIANYIVICSSDRTPQTLAGVADGMVAVRTERWARGGESGQVVYGTHDNAGALAVGFDGAARNFCSVVANGRDRTSGQDMYDHWFRDAPL